MNTYVNTNKLEITFKIIEKFWKGISNSLGGTEITRPLRDATHVLRILC